MDSDQIVDQAPAETDEQAERKRPPRLCSKAAMSRFPTTPHLRFAEARSAWNVSTGPSTCSTSNST
ncbi:hypothetical protein BZL30_9449 [Mycobacterium kansasii]|uniref:Uncharacterized protein n=1 Tax=Mycobacterium kansasii TaxID=1768 RepID=A0A1V3W929_MYCKA|nr:hypothetical protein BZL30_9449 [Mycobacterium kansasii]